MGINIFRTTLAIVRSGSIATNLALSGYLFFLNETVYDWFFYDSVHEASSDILYSGTTNPFLGAILIAAIFGEFTAFVLKARYGPETSSEGPGIFLLWMFHTVVSVIMTIIAMGAFGINFDNHRADALLSAALFASVIKEIAILVIIIGGIGKRRSSKLKNLLADMLFLLFYSLAFTTVIGNILKPHDYSNYLMASHYSIPLTLLNTFIVILLFFMLYLPLRIPYFLYERYENTRELIIGGLSILLVAAGVVLPLFDGETSIESALEHPRDVEMLFLNGRGITELPEDITKLTDLRVLHLGYNNIHEIPEWIVRLERLQWIGLGGNSFREFPVILLELPRLREIDLHYNRIKKLPDDLTRFTRLRSLNLRSNSMLPPEKKRVRDALEKSENNPRGIILTL